MKICKLCQKPKESLEKSHVIPDAFWRKVKGRTKGKKNGLYISIKNNNNQYGQDTYTEELLCWDCEQKLSINLENYAAKLCLQNPSNIGVTITKQEKSRCFSGVNYEKLKLFQLSVLWRASISTESIYSEIKLIPSEEERLRQALYDLEPLKENEYGCIMSLLWINHDQRSTRESKAFIISPYADSVGQHDFFVFVFGGFEWRFSHPSCSLNSIDEQRVITRQGTINCQLKDVHSDPVLFQAAFNGYKNQKEGRGVDA
ncbi:MAG: hypothetical protein VX829_03430 [Pseudomonadota bacterium]|uniref:hypothetical protein n=1 Tax=Methylophaga aminisulfidivorans TaxID=230105 RepID=UPI0024E1A604|nr:hypothetical protein [Methylophaga aminisulfidivorans]MEC9411713.1 hypothetical protein [Pseudomonadota bacterium]